MTAAVDNLNLDSSFVPVKSFEEKEEGLLPLTGDEKVKITKLERAKKIAIFTALLVAKVAIIVFVVLVSIALFLANPYIFFAGLFVGIVFDEKARATAEKIRNVCLKHPWIIIPLAVGSFFALPVAVSIGSFACGAFVASYLAGTVDDDFNEKSLVVRGLNKIFPPKEKSQPEVDSPEVDLPEVREKEITEL